MVRRWKSYTCPKHYCVQDLPVVPVGRQAGHLDVRWDHPGHHRVHGGGDLGWDDQAEEQEAQEEDKKGREKGKFQNTKIIHSFLERGGGRGEGLTLRQNTRKLIDI